MSLKSGKNHDKVTITTVNFQSEDSSLRGCYPFPQRLLKNLFYRALKKDRKLRVFLQYFKIPEGESFHVLPQGNSNYLDIYCTADELGNLVISHQFMDAKSKLVYVTVTFPKDGVHYYVPKVEFIARVDGVNQVFTIDIDESLFSAGFKLTKKQVLNLVFSRLGELALIRFFDYFVDTRREKDYQKSKILSRFMVTEFRKYDITYDIPTKTFFIKPKDNNHKNDFRRSSAYVRMIGLLFF